MFQIGDKIMYPMHGAGVIEAIEEKEVLGETCLYYIMNISVIDMQVMIPVGKTEDLGIREVVPSDTMENVLTLFHRGESDSTMNVNQRFRINTNKIKSGDIYEGAEVIRDLTRLSKAKGLGTGDKIMLDKAQKILLSELVLVKQIAHDQAVHLLNKVINI